MTFARCDSWAVALWVHYLPSISSGAPFYLAVDGRLIRELYVTKLGGTGGPEAELRDFHAACLTLLDTAGTRTVVRRGAFHRIPGAVHSRVICLAVQQVLVVERMLHDVQYSEQSYFPRYREVLGILGHREHSSPMATQAFREVWDVLGRELSAVPGAGAKTVTFVVGKGRDRNRSFPLSQALFTAHDLTVIREESTAFDDRAADRSLLTALLRVREHLGVRARKLLSAAATDEMIASRLCTQVRSFLTSDVLASLRGSRTASMQTGAIVAYLERADAFADHEEDTFSVYHRSDTEQSAGAALEEAIGRRLSAAPVVFLVPDADGFREWSRGEPLDRAGTVLAIVESLKVHLFEDRVAESYGASFIAAKSSLPARFALLVCSSGIAPHITVLLGLREHGEGIELEGGLLADARSRVFLAGYPPTGIHHDGRLLGGSEEVIVGGVCRRVQEFLDALRSQSDSVRFTIQVGQAGLSLSVASRRQSSKTQHQLAYALREGELDLVARPVEPNHLNLRGTRFSEASSQQTARLAHSDVAMLLDRGRRLAVSDAHLSLIMGEIALVEKANPLASLAARQIATTRSIPLKVATSGLLRRLQAARGEHSGKAT
ncbi:MAG: hypothetical protein ABI193_14335 [Minicystis sp.]